MADVGEPTGGKVFLANTFDVIDIVNDNLLNLMNSVDGCHNRFGQNGHV